MYSNEIIREIKKYLAKVAEHLQNTSLGEKDEILQNIETHIYDALKQRFPENPTIEDLNAVISEMDAPQFYSQVGKLDKDAKIPAKFCKLPVIGVLWAPFGIFIILSIMCVQVVPAGEIVKVSIWQWIGRFTLLPLGVLAPFACTTLGLMGISKIRNSAGRLIGLPLAVFDTLLYPVIVLDGVFIYCLLMFTRGFWIFLGIFLIILLDIFIVVFTWKVASKPLNLQLNK